MYHEVLDQGKRSGGEGHEVRVTLLDQCEDGVLGKSPVRKTNLGRIRSTRVPIEGTKKSLENREVQE